MLITKEVSTMKAIRSTTLLLATSMLSISAAAHHGPAHTEANISLVLAAIGVALAAAAFMARRRRS